MSDRDVGEQRGALRILFPFVYEVADVTHLNHTYHSEPQFPRSRDQRVHHRIP